MTDMTVAATILEQLGGRAFLRMTGAKHLLGCDTALIMSLPGSLTTDRINRVRINLDPSDTYTVTTYKFSSKTLACPAVDKRRDVYAENLREAFTALTGLETRMPRVVFDRRVA